VHDVWQDAKFGARLLRRSPLFAIVALATIALGVSAVTAIFAVVHAVVLRPLPFQEPERLLALWESNPERGWMFTYAAPANSLDWRERVSSFEDLAAHGGTGKIPSPATAIPKGFPAHTSREIFSRSSGSPPVSVVGSPWRRDTRSRSRGASRASSTE